MNTSVLTTTILVLDIIGKSPQMKEALETIRLAADTGASVLITGEKGTEKDLVAKAIHKESSRQKFPFVRINCSAHPETLRDFELFGNANQAAEEMENGRPGPAHRGTVFLDEISELSLPLQGKLLRVLQESHLKKTGGTGSPGMDIQILAATHKDLWKCIREKTFRYDLYSRLNAIPIHIPPLRERKEDLPMLLEYYLKKFCEEQKKQGMQLSPESRDAIILYDWPGNMGEFVNAIERIVALHPGGTVEKQHLPSFLTSHLEKGATIKTLSPRGETLEKAVGSFEKGLIIEALKQNSGIKARAARQLGLSRSNLQYKIKKYGISRV